MLTSRASAVLAVTALQSRKCAFHDCYLLSAWAIGKVELADVVSERAVPMFMRVKREQCAAHYALCVARLQYRRMLTKKAISRHMVGGIQRESMRSV